MSWSWSADDSRYRPVCDVCLARGPLVEEPKHGQRPLPRGWHLVIMARHAPIACVYGFHACSPACESAARLNTNGAVAKLLERT